MLGTDLSGGNLLLSCFSTKFCKNLFSPMRATYAAHFNKFNRLTHLPSLLNSQILSSNLLTSLQIFVLPTTLFNKIARFFVLLWMGWDKSSSIPNYFFTYFPSITFLWTSNPIFIVIPICFNLLELTTSS